MNGPNFIVRLALLLEFWAICVLHLFANQAEHFFIIFKGTSYCQKLSRTYDKLLS